MKIISHVRISGFRSIADDGLMEIGDHTVIVGKNSSGKSNILRALNLFFNGETSRSVGIDFARDLHYRPTIKKKKEVRIEVDFDVPKNFNFRTGLEKVKNLGDRFTIKKVWGLDRLRNVIVDTSITVDGRLMDDIDDQVARDFLSLIVFRYIPNRTIPADLLKDESQAVASAIFKKSKEIGKAGDVLRDLSASAGRLLAKTSGALLESGAPISNPNIATSGSLGEMLRMSGFQAQGLNGVVVRDEDWGAGHQSFFLLNLLREIDTDYSRQFGWRQACIWAVEEPESGLHHDLQTRLARQFMEWSTDQQRRLQIFTTTHSPVLTMSGDKGYWVDIGEFSSVCKSMPISELVRAAEEKGVSTYLHPALSFPFNPVVLVEGGIDELVLNYVAGHMGRQNLKFISLPALDRGENSGVDAQISYIRKNAKLIHRRPPEAPFIVLVDWDVTDTKIIQLRNLYGQNADRYVIRPPVSLSSVILDGSFRGIERFYPEDLLRSAHGAGDITVAFPEDESKQWSISSGVFDAGKSALAARVVAIRDVSKFGAIPNLIKLCYAASTSVADDQSRLIP